MRNDRDLKYPKSIKFDRSRARNRNTNGKSSDLELNQIKLFDSKLIQFVQTLRNFNLRIL